MSRLEKLKQKAKALEAKDPKGAIDAWLEAVKAQEGQAEPDPDLSIFNRIGDLYLKIKDAATAADYYDRAVDKYAEHGLHNNAIAMCNKVLRNAPGRQTTYLKLAKLYASKGFMAEAKQNFVEYAERMHKVGKIQHAFAALKELADISAESAHLRETLEVHLRMYGAPERRPGAGAAAPAAPKAQPPEDPSKSGKRKTSSLVFLDVDAPPVAKGPPVKGRVAIPPKPVPEPEPEPALDPEPAVESLIEPVTAEPDTSLEIESTSLVEGLEATNAGGRLEGFETTSAEFGDIDLDAADVPSLRDEVAPEDIPPPAEFEPTVPEEASASDSAVELQPLLETEIEIEAPKAKAPPRVAPVVPKRPAVGAPPRFAGGGTAAKAAEPPKVKPGVPKRPAPPSRKTLVEVPPLELEPDFDTSATDREHDVDDQPQAIDDLRAGVSGGGGRRSGAIDLSLDGVVTERDEPGSLVFANIDATPAKPTIEQLEGRVAADRSGRAGAGCRGARPGHDRFRDPGEPAAGAGFGGRDPATRSQQRAAPAEAGGIRVQVGRQGQADRRVRRARRHAVTERPPRQGPRRLQARRRARSHQRAREGRARDARAGDDPPAGAAAEGETDRPGHGGKDRGSGREDEGAGRGRRGRGLRGPERDDPRGRSAGARHAHEGRRRRADRGRGTRLSGDARALQAGDRREHRRGRLSVALRSGRGLQGDGPLGRGDCGAAEGAAGARRKTQKLRGTGRVLPRQGRLRRGGVDPAARAGPAGRGWRPGASGRPVLAGPRARGTGEAGRSPRAVRPGVRGGHPIPGRGRALQGARQGEVA